MKSSLTLLILGLSIFLAGCAGEMSKGSSTALYTISNTLEVKRADLHKDVQLRLNQKLFFNFEPDPEKPGDWELVHYHKQTLLLLSDTPRVASGNWGLLMQARALGFSSLELRFTPLDETLPPETYPFSITISR